MGIGAAIGLGAATLGGALISSQASNEAADTQANAAQNATQAQLQMYNQNREDLGPYRQAGYSALNALTNLLGIPSTAVEAGPLIFDASQAPNSPYGGNPNLFGFEGQQNNNLQQIQSRNKSIGAQLSQAPGYQFRLEQGLNALDRSAAANGTRLSGAAVKAAERYGQGLASQEFANRFNRLAALAGVGQAAVGTTAALGANAANNQASNMLAAGNARAAGQVGQANAINNGIQNAAYLYGASQGYFGGS